MKKNWNKYIIKSIRLDVLKSDDFNNMNIREINSWFWKTHNGLAQSVLWTDSRRKEKANITTNYFKNNPDAVERNRLKTIEQFSVPSARSEMGEIIKNSDAHKIATEKQSGGKDLLWHHIAYDFNNPNDLKVRITRGFHGKIHHPHGLYIKGYILTD